MNTNYEEIKTRFMSVVLAEQDRIFESALRNTAAPPIKGEITRGKIRWRGIRLVIKNTGCKCERWIEQRGKRISKIITTEAVYKLGIANGDGADVGREQIRVGSES